MKSAVLVALSIGILASGGCLKLDETLTLRQDGAGTFELVYSISEQAVSQAQTILKIRDRLSAFNQDDSTDPLADRQVQLFLNPTEAGLKRELARYERNGITVSRLKVATREGWRHVSMRLDFRSLAEAAKADFFPQHGFTIAKDGSGNYVFYRPAQSRNPTSPAALDPETVKMMSPLLGGFNAVFKIVVPGRIMTASTTQKSLYSAVWTFNIDRDPAALVALQNQEIRILFEGEGIALPQVSGPGSRRNP